MEYSKNIQRTGIEWSIQRIQRTGEFNGQALSISEYFERMVQLVQRTGTKYFDCYVWNDE